MPPKMKGESSSNPPLIDEEEVDEEELYEEEMPHVESGLISTSSDEDKGFSYSSYSSSSSSPSDEDSPKSKLTCDCCEDFIEYDALCTQCKQCGLVWHEECHEEGYDYEEMTRKKVFCKCMDKLHSARKAIKLYKVVKKGNGDKLVPVDKKKVFPAPP